jgi:hypothetical protein
MDILISKNLYDQEISAKLLQIKSETIHQCTIGCFL